MSWLPAQSVDLAGSQVSASEDSVVEACSIDNTLLGEMQCFCFGSPRFGRRIN